MPSIREQDSEKSKLGDFLRRAQRHLDARELHQAKMIVKSAILQWPGAMRLHLMNAEILEAEGRLQQAQAFLRRTVERFPGHVQPTIALAHICVRCGALDEARGALAAAKTRGLDDDAALRLELLIAKAGGNWSDAISSAEKIIRRDGQRLAQMLLTLAHARLQTNDAAGAEDAASRALANDPKLVPAALVAAHAATERGDPARMVQHYRTLSVLAPDDARWPLKIVSTLSVSGRYQEAVEELEAVLERWSSNALVKKFLQRSPLGGTLLEDAIRALPEPQPDALADEDDEPEEPVEPGGKRGLARRTAVENVQKSTGQEITALRALLERAPADAELRRAVVVDSLREEVLVGEQKGSEALVFVFTAVNDRMWMPLGMFDRYLASLGVTAVYLKDFQRLLHLNGVRSIGADYSATVAKLREMASRLGAKRVLAIGHSGGARPAIRYGVELGAERIVSFGGATSRTPCLMGTDRQFNGIIWKRALAEIPEEMLDLKPFLDTRRHKSAIELVFAEGIESERADAEYLAGSPGVTLHPVPGEAQDTVIRSLAERPDFRQTLADLLGLNLNAPAKRPRRAR